MFRETEVERVSTGGDSIRGGSSVLASVNQPCLLSASIVNLCEMSFSFCLEMAKLQRERK